MINELYDKVETKRGVNAITHYVARRAAMHLGVGLDGYNGVISGLR